MIAYLGIGSNVGDRVDFVRRTVRMISEVPGIGVISVSSVYETTPLGGPPQRSFINIVAAVETDLSPHELLVEAKRIEAAVGRTESAIKWGPRVTDVDILLYGDTKFGEPDLEIPHPLLTRRRFALVPLLEIAPDAADPWGRRYADYLDEAEGSVELLEPF